MKRRCLKWVCMIHLSIWNINYGQKKGQESNCQFDFRPLKVTNHLDLLACRWPCHLLLENFRQWLQLFFGPHLNERFVQKVMGLQSCGSPNFMTPNMWIPGQNDIWVLALWPNIENTIRGKVVASPKSRSWWILWVCVCSWLVHA